MANQVGRDVDKCATTPWAIPYIRLSFTIDLEVFRSNLAVAVRDCSRSAKRPRYQLTCWMLGFQALPSAE